jgi:hypothetical protein
VHGSGGGDPGRIARFRDALLGGHLSYSADRTAAYEVERAFPGTAAMLGSALDFHRRAAAWTAAGSRYAPPAASVVFTAAGLPPPGVPLHTDAAAVSPSCRFGYSCCDESTRDVAAAALPGDVSVFRADPADPAGVVAAAGEAGLPVSRPAGVHIVMAAPWWPEKLLREVAGGYARLLAPGSCLALSGVSGTGNFIAGLGRALGAELHAHEPARLARCLADAGLSLQPWGVRDAANWGQPSPVRENGKPRIVAAVGIVP